MLTFQISYQYESTKKNYAVFTFSLPWQYSAGLGLALLSLSWDKNWDSHSLVNGYPSFYPRIALVAPSPGILFYILISLHIYK